LRAIGLSELVARVRKERKSSDLSSLTDVELLREIVEAWSDTSGNGAEHKTKHVALARTFAVAFYLGHSPEKSAELLRALGVTDYTIAQLEAIVASPIFAEFISVMQSTCAHRYDDPFVVSEEVSESMQRMAVLAIEAGLITT
jgi:hypothetical protein